MTSDTSEVVRSLERASEGLLFPSESDFPIKALRFGVVEPTPEALLRDQGLSADQRVELSDVGSFFEGLTEAPADASEGDRATAAKFSALRSLLETELSDLRVYRVGKTDISLFVLGRHSSGEWLGITTQVVET